MPWNNMRFGELKDALNKNLYNQIDFNHIPSPPLSTYLLVDDSSEQLLDDSIEGDYFVVKL